MNTRILLCCLFALTFGCVDKVELKNENFTAQPVIWAELTSDGNLRAQVSLTTNIDTKSSNNFIDDATIRLWKVGENKPILENFNYVKEYNSYYPINPVEIEAGGVYWVEIKLNDGSSYVSSQEKMPPAINVSDIAYVNNQLRAIFHDKKDEPNYYFAEFEISQKIISDETNEYLQVVSNDILFDGNEKAYVGEYFNLNKNTSYNVALKLHSISNSSYLFYRSFIEQKDLNEGVLDEEGGGDAGWMFSKPPVNLYGNITKKENGKKVLGQFIISSISYKNKTLEK